MPRISIPDDSPPVLAPSAVFPALQARAQLDYHDTLPGNEDVLTERIGAAEVVLNIRASTRFTARVFAACPNLRLLSVWGTGTDHVDLASAARHGVTVTNTPGVSARSIAEHALALLFAVARRIPEMDAATRRRTVRQDLRRRRLWRHWPPLRAPGGGARHARHRLDDAPEALRGRGFRRARRNLWHQRRGEPASAALPGDGKLRQRRAIRSDEAQRDPDQHGPRRDRP